MKALSDYEKIRRLPYYYSMWTLTWVAYRLLAAEPLVLFMNELGFSKAQIGLVGSILPFTQIVSFLLFPLVLVFGAKKMAVTGWGIRYFTPMLYLAVPLVIHLPQGPFLIVVATMTLFSLFRAVGETALYPWEIDLVPRSIRGKVKGWISIFIAPLGLIVSFIVRLWLDSRVGSARFYPVFVTGCLFGIAGVLCMTGLPGAGRLRKSSEAAKPHLERQGLFAVLKDRNFRLFLISEALNILQTTAVTYFAILFFRESLGLEAGLLVFLAALGPVGAVVSSLTVGWGVDRFGTRPIRCTLFFIQGLFFAGWLLLKPGLPGLGVIVGLVYTLMGFFGNGLGITGSLYVMNNAPADKKESYLAFIYGAGGIFGGISVVGAGGLLNRLESAPFRWGGQNLDPFRILFVIASLFSLISGMLFLYLREEHAMGLKDFIGRFFRGRPLKAIWNIFLFSGLLSESRRMRMSERLGNLGASLAEDELFILLRDPSFEVRYEAIRSLGRLPRNARNIEKLKECLAYGDDIEIQMAAISALGRMRVKEAAPLLYRFLESRFSILRMRAARALGAIGDPHSESVLLHIVETDEELEVRFSASWALGRLRSRKAVPVLLSLYRELCQDQNRHDHKQKAVLLGLAQILGFEAEYAKVWRREDLSPGVVLPKFFRGSVRRLIRTLSAMTDKPEGSDRPALTDKTTRLERAASCLADGDTGPAADLLQEIYPVVAIRCGNLGRVPLSIIGLLEVKPVHPALIVLACTAMVNTMTAGSTPRLTGS